MLNLDELKELIKLMDDSNLTEFKLKNDDYELSLKKELPVSNLIAQPNPSIQHQDKATPLIMEEETSSPMRNEQPFVHKDEQVNEELHKVISPMVGTFYAAPAPDAPPYVQVGDQVTEDTIVCIVEAMKLMNEIEAEVRGTIVEVLVENGQLVEYGQPLFLVKVE